ncbi:hypothetical protein BDQ17DRAFT_1368613 [Cyathus striatus]|nr:hypothetical protein BDQ17DRAFT_1368613 [Cyathus striatus]
MSWVNAKDIQEKMVWMSGPAGAGKSSIAQTVAERCHEENKLVSSFFFSRTATGTGRDDGTKFVPTIAYQMTASIPSVKNLVLGVIEENEAILTYTMEDQIRDLVMRPLKKAIELCYQSCLSIPHVVIIDGLDECSKPKIQSRIVKMIASVLLEPSVHLRFLIASRTELEIRTTFDEPLVRQFCNKVVLDNHYNPDKDIETFLLSEFATVKRAHVLFSTLSKEPNWPSEKNLRTLVKRSSGQFIYAATVIKYIKDNRDDPRERLKTIIAIRQGETTPYSDLDALYTHVLTVAVLKGDGYDNILIIFQILIYIYNSNLSRVPIMAEFCGVTDSRLRLRMGDLHSLVYVPVKDAYIDQGSVRFFHASFKDYLTDKSRSKAFFTSKKKAHKALENCCLTRILECPAPSKLLDFESTLGYAYSYFLRHLSGSNYNKKLLKQFLVHNDKCTITLVREMLYQYMEYTVGSSKDDDGGLEDIICMYFSIDYSAKDNSKFVVPIEGVPSELCVCIFNAMDKSIMADLSDEDDIDKLCIEAILLINNGRTYGNEDDDSDICLYWMGVMLENIERGKMYFLGDERSQCIFRRLWDDTKERNPYFCYDFGNTPVSSFAVYYGLSPTIFNYLLKRIKPSSTFAIYLREFAPAFEVWFYDKRNYEPDDYVDDLVKSSMNSLKADIDAYLNECVSLEESQTESNEDHSNSNLRYKMALNYICN